MKNKIRKVKTLLLFLFFINQITHCQNILTGTILDETTKIPIDYASVYISGTTIGAYTDAKGHFSLKDVTFPCQLVVSHVAYNVNTNIINENSPKEITIYIREKTRLLNEVQVADKSMRDKNIREFKLAFLGDDYWGSHAILRNDSVLIFSHRTDTVRRSSDSMDFVKQRKYKSIGENSQWSADSSTIITCTPVFSVQSKAPLMIELPLLGYTVFVDLVRFSLKKHKYWEDCDSWSYCRFSQYSGTTPRQQRKFESNREKVYYNSVKHFFHSLFFDRLKENGYLIATQTYNKETKEVQKVFIDISPFMQYTKSKELLISGLKKKTLYIYYFDHLNGKPADLTIQSHKNRVGNIWERFRTGISPDNNSEMLFKSDTCTIRANGTTPDNNILFGGKFTTKRWGALLPYDYVPEEQE
ncbi:carboxypeptidase-like regulatory domain-containing protein [Parabacteroides sp. FAFU027]|uniref:carboxypeptidase-like regulatory domain-containing protein n=1 Tax=Parabacteroides sp. FAFU027 TaxID=2922715 RepID=UPI001FAF84FE|nr:carboxypeptidase-like regulatory domain-containing protein [Parabacteroides sp. FAFU027]